MSEDIAQATIVAAQELGQEVVEAYEQQGIPVIAGPCTIQLVVNHPNALTPLSAVEDMLAEVALNGLRDYAYLVRDEETNRSWFVFDGRIVTPDELNVDEGDDDDDEDDEDDDE
jgi:hypothetical protein